MDFEAVKKVVLSFWLRYGASWILKALTGYLGYDAATAQTMAGQLAAGGGAVLVMALDYWHSKSVHQASASNK